MRKVKCKNTCCRHNDIKTGGCKVTVEIGTDGRCRSFEKGFIYYIDLVWKALGGGNFIDALQMTQDLRIGMYYVMSIYRLGFAEQEWGTCRMFLLKDGEDGPALKASEIVAREIDMEKFTQLVDDFENGILPGQNKEQEQRPGPGEKAYLDFGWLSPAGDYTESPFGNHEESAYAICEARDWQEERRRWGDEESNSGLCRDFISAVKGYCLIHNPTGAGGYIVTCQKKLTKRQREFLYEFFTDKGDRFKAEQYLEEE